MGHLKCFVFEGVGLKGPGYAVGHTIAYKYRTTITQHSLTTEVIATIGLPRSTLLTLS